MIPIAYNNNGIFNFISHNDILPILIFNLSTVK